MKHQHDKPHGRAVLYVKEVLHEGKAGVGSIKTRGQGGWDGQGQEAFV